MLAFSLATLASVARPVPLSTRIQPPSVFGGAWMRSKDRAGGGDMDTTSARGSNPASNATGHPGLAGRILRRRTGLPGRTGCGRRGTSGGMASAWLVVAVLMAHVASVNAVFRVLDKVQLDYAIQSCLTNVPSGVQCCAASPHCNAGPGTISFTDDIGDWDTSLVTDMSSLFANRASFNADISGWDTSQVTNMESIFGDAFVFNQNISSWNTSQVTDMTRMFNYAEAFDQPIGTWDTSKVDTMAYMFSRAFAFNQPIGSWDTSQVTEMQQMFRGDSKPSAFNQPIGNWDTSKVTTMNAMFRGGAATYAFNQPIGNWDTSRVTDMKEMFNNAYDFNQDVTGWDTTSLSDSTRMFDDADAWQARYARSPSSTDGPPSAWSRIANECDAAVPLDQRRRRHLHRHPGERLHVPARVRLWVHGVRRDVVHGQGADRGDVHSRGGIVHHDPVPDRRRVCVMPGRIGQPGRRLDHLLLPRELLPRRRRGRGRRVRLLRVRCGPVQGSGRRGSDRRGSVSRVDAVLREVEPRRVDRNRNVQVGGSEHADIRQVLGQGRGYSRCRSPRRLGVCRCR